MAEVDVHILQQQPSNAGQHTACACTRSADLHRTQVCVSPVLYPDAVSASTDVDAHPFGAQTTATYFQPVGLAGIDLDNTVNQPRSATLHENTIRQTAVRGDVNTIQNKMTAEGLRTMRCRALRLDARAYGLYLSATGGRNTRRTVAARQHAVLLQHNPAVRAFGPRSGSTHALGSEIDRTGWNNGASIERMEGMAGRVAGLHGLGRAVVAGHGCLFVTVGDDPLRLYGSNGCEYGCQRQRQRMVTGEVNVHGMSLGKLQTCSVSSPLPDIE
ncbi:hypothetical protein [Stenotrophomonas maltophilia]|uniref:hypothetical protein n=1 Tax=Stenotrophomonas maltophilia TaxID=40324 RepID=UPI00315B1A2C